MPINSPTELPADPTLDDYQFAATASAIYPGRRSPLGLIYTALKLNGEAGEFAEHVGKAMRDDGFMELALTGKLTPDRRAKLILELGDVLWYISAAASELGLNLSSVAHANITKLRARQAAGTLQGSGDNR